jgi:hypothetical protein
VIGFRTRSKSIFFQFHGKIPIHQPIFFIRNHISCSERILSRGSRSLPRAGEKPPCGLWGEVIIKRPRQGAGGDSSRQSLRPQKVATQSTRQSSSPLVTTRRELLRVPEVRELPGRWQRVQRGTRGCRTRGNRPAFHRPTPKGRRWRGGEVNSNSRHSKRAKF